MPNVYRYYEILELRPGADFTAIKFAYRRLVKAWHPDRFSGQPDAQQAAEERLKQINRAYEYFKAHPDANTTLPEPALDEPLPLQAQWYYERGVQKTKQEDYIGAIAAFTRAIALQADFLDAYKYRGLVYSILGKDRKANADLQRMAQLKRQARRQAAAPPRAPTACTIKTPTAPWLCAGTLRSHNEAVSAIALSIDGRYIISSSEDETVRIWRLDNGRQIRVLSGHTGPVHCVAVSPDNRWIASGSDDRSIRLWNLHTGQLIRTLGGWLGGHRQAVKALYFHPDRKRLASGSSDKTIRLWKIASGKELRCITGYQHPITQVAISPDGKTLVSGCTGQALKIRHLGNGHLLQTVQDEHPIEALAFSPDGLTLVTGGRDRVIRCWDLATGTVRHTYPGHLSGVSALAYSRDGRWLLSGGQDGSLKLWQTTTGREICHLQDHRDRVCGVAISPDNQALISGSRDQTIKIWWRN